MNSSTRASSRPEKIKVLYVIWSLQMGGAERVVSDTARKLDRERFEPMVACLNFKGLLAEELEKQGIKVFCVDKKPKLDLGVIGKLADIMRRERVDIVHTHLWTASFWGRLAAIRARVPVIVVTEHNLDLWRRAWHFWADRILGFCTKHWIFVSDEVRDFYLEHLSLAPGDYTVVHNGIDLEQFEHSIDAAEVRARMGIPAGRQVVGVVGRLEERKGHRYFLEAMKGMERDAPEVLGLVIGTGKEMDNLKAQQKALGLQDTVRLQGFWASLPEALAVMDVFALPSLMEGHPLAVLEAMGAGKAVVATTVGGNAEAVAAGVTGLLVPPADPEALRKAILELMRDPERRAAMGKEARRRMLERFNLAIAVNANQDVYLKYAAN